MIFDEWIEEEPDIELYFEYIVNCGCKVGSWLDRELNGFELDEEDLKNRQQLTDLLCKPLRDGIFKNCNINEMFTRVKINE